MKTDKVLLVLLVIFLALLLWQALDAVAEAQGEYWYLTRHYYYEGRRKIYYPVVCNRYYTCKLACRTLYGGWGPCR